MNRVLILDSEGASRDLLVEALSIDECEVLVAAGWAEALDRLKEGGVDVLLAEVHMPDGAAWDFLPRVHAAAPTLPVVAMASDDSYDTARKTRSRGAPLFFYAIRPLDVKEIRQVVRCACDWRSRALSANGNPAAGTRSRKG